MDKKNDAAANKTKLVIVKKYANRRLYNTESSTYVTLEDLATMVRSERDFVVTDAKSGADLTHSVLTQIIVEQESRTDGHPMLPIPFLRQLIRFYGKGIERMVPSYLQASLEVLAKEQERFSKQFASAFGTPIDAYQETARKNMEMFEKSLKMFSPFGAGVAPGANAAGEGNKGDDKPAKTETTKTTKTDGNAELAKMRAQLEAMQKTVDKLTKDRG